MTRVLESLKTYALFLQFNKNDKSNPIEIIEYLFNNESCLQISLDIR
jgi:hypothetical protein